MIPQEFDWTVRRPDYLAPELRIAKWAALGLPVLTLAVLPFSRAMVRFVGTLSASQNIIDWRSVFSPAALGLVVVSSAAPLLWLAAARLEARGMLPRRWPWAVCASLVLTGILCLPFAVPRTKWFFLKAARLRFEGASFVRPITHWQLAAMEKPPKRGRRIAVVGSSQMDYAVDVKLMQEFMPKEQPEKWCLPGLGIMEYHLVARDLIGRQTDVAVCWLSEFDVFREERIPANRLRYFADLPELHDLLKALPMREAWRSRAQLADLAAAIVPLWRQRDMIRRLVFDLWWPACAEESASQDAPAPDSFEHLRENLRRSIWRTGLVESNFESFQRFAEVLAANHVDLWVFEGWTNPLAAAVYDPKLRVETRERFRQMSMRVPFRYVTEDQMPRFTAQDFRDAYHLGEEAKTRFTRYLAARLTQGDASAR